MCDIITSMDAEYTVTGDPELSPSGKSRIPVIYKGQDAWLYGDNGNRSIRNSSGHWLAPADGKYTIDKDNSRQLNAARWENARKAAASGALKAAEAKGLTLAHPVEAWEAVVEARTTVALDTGSRGGNAAAELVGKAAGWLATKSEASEQPAITINAAGIEALVAAVQREQERRIDGDVIDV